MGLLRAFWPYFKTYLCTALCACKLEDLQKNEELFELPKHDLSAVTNQGLNTWELNKLCV